jgi:hypothetical protein
MPAGSWHCDRAEDGPAILIYRRLNGSIPHPADELGILNAAKSTN